MEFLKPRFVFVALFAAVILLAAVFFAPEIKNYFLNKAKPVTNKQNSANQIPLPPPPPQKLANPPEIIKSIYMTGYSAGSKSYLKYLDNLFKNTEINAVVVDVKGSDGYVTYNSSVSDVQKYHLTNFAISDIDFLVKFLHSQNIYVIGRIAVFEDPVYAKAKPELAVYNKAGGMWQDNNGLAWLDPASKDVWDYDVSLAKDALNNHGFDEVNFDYVRFPTDGKISNMGFPIYDGKIAKANVIKSFFQYLRTNLADKKISIDLFGLTTVNSDDMGIGQVIENAFENFDYVCPMVYPSHYANGFIGFANPAEHPYDVIKYSLDSALVKEKAEQISVPAPFSAPLGKLRPWLQDFNMGAIYTADLVDQEIKATKDSLGSNYSGFMLWNPSNVYTQSAILKAN